MKGKEDFAHALALRLERLINKNRELAPTTSGETENVLLRALKQLVSTLLVG